MGPLLKLSVTGLSETGKTEGAGRALESFASGSPGPVISQGLQGFEDNVH